MTGINFVIMLRAPWLLKVSGLLFLNVVPSIHYRYKAVTVVAKDITWSHSRGPTSVWGFLLALSVSYSKSDQRRSVGGTPAATAMLHFLKL